ncbi:hypothetical protein [Marinobacter xestospongiae]|uniref:Lipoprotein n=1 Tax=Marinobacter xestospongiae TaxID=994319 RepID=A0ABU3W1U8_9GAMM|nr:hypothetical protein [Marinobacter xestospongiae]MDV2080501.1 hypothetical protein [Marinobacter xestospongiae]
MKMMRLAPALLLAGVLAACGSGSDSPANEKPVDQPGDVPQPPTNGDLVDIAPAPSAYNRDVAFALTLAYQSQVTHLDVNEDGVWCDVRRLGGYGNDLYTTWNWQPGWAQSLQCHVGAQQIFSHQPDDGAVIVDMAMLEANRILVLEAVATGRLIGATPDQEVDDSAEFYELRLTQLDGNGEVLQQRWLEDAPDETELNYYSYDLATKEVSYSVFEALSHDDRPQLPLNGFARLQVQDGVPYLLAHTYGVKVYRLNSDLTVAWDQQVMPAYPWLYRENLSNDSRLAIREDGSVAVAYELFDEDVAVYNAHFGQPLLDANPGADIGVTVLSPDGQPERAFLAGMRDHSEGINALFWQSDELVLTGSTLHEKADAAGGTTEWDGYVARVDSTSGETTQSQLLHIHDEDVAYDALLTDGGRLLIAGKSGYGQADTGSQLNYGYGVIYEVSDDGKVEPLLKLDRPRDSVVRGIQVVGDTLYYRFDFDGFITHTCDNDDTQCWLKSGVSNLALD